MKELPLLKSPKVYIEITQTALKVLRENEGLHLPLERGATGQITDGCEEKVISELQTFLQRKNWLPRTRALCAIEASGLSLRRIALPATAREELPKLLRLQIESEFPLGPDELAWGYRTLGASGNGATKQEILVAAVKKARVEDYAAILTATGLNPVFTPATLARSYLCPQPPGSCALLDVGEKQLEFVSFQDGVPIGVRAFAWGAENNGSSQARLDSIVKAIGQPPGNKIYISGANGAPADFISAIRLRLPAGVQWELLQAASGPGHSAAILGMKRASEDNIGAPLVLLQTAPKTAARGPLKFTEAVPKRWAIRAAALLCALLVLPYAEALLLKAHLEKKLSNIEANQGRFAAIDHELDFLRSLKQNQPPYLDALYLLAEAAPPGARLNSTSMNRQGEIALRGTMQNAQQVTDFRSKLMNTGFFERVTVDEQVPTPDHQKVNIRVSAQWKPVQARAGLAIGPTRDEIEKAKTNAPANMPPGLMIQ